jgi:hypothetical protein
VRDEPNWNLDQYRRRHGLLPDTPKGANVGYFEKKWLRIISSGSPEEGEPGWPWEHVSVSVADRCPTWKEMALVKDLFWKPEETVLQFHPKASAYVNHHPFCLHLWRKVGADHELPPRHLIT